jgi:hypothetical protein
MKESDYKKALERVINEAPKAMKNGCEKYAWLRKIAGADADAVLCSPEWLIISERWDKEQNGKRDARGFKLLESMIGDIEKKRKSGEKLQALDLQVILNYNNYSLRQKDKRDRFAQTLCERVQEREAAERAERQLLLAENEDRRKEQLQQKMLVRFDVEVERLKIAIELAKEKLAENPEEAQELLNPRIMSLEEALDMLSGFKELPQ